jgi:hypothetical protein
MQSLPLYIVSTGTDRSYHQIGDPDKGGGIFFFFFFFLTLIGISYLSYFLP